MDDILIDGGQTEAEHQAYVEQILQQCVNHGLAVNLTKSEFHVHETIFLGHIGNGSQVQMDPAKLETMSMCPVRTKEKEVQAFFSLLTTTVDSLRTTVLKHAPSLTLLKMYHSVGDINSSKPSTS